jgi:chromosomal replication initiation ATPase DnaA
VSNPYDHEDEEGEEAIEVHVTVPRRVAERLADHYPSALSLPEGIRMAVDDAVETREQRITREDITEATTNALEQGPIEVEVSNEPD